MGKRGINMLLYLVRHGRTDWNAQRRIQGRKDILLNAVGIKQINDLADMIVEKGKEAVFYNMFES